MLTKSPYYYYFGDPQPFNTFSDGDHPNHTHGGCSGVLAEPWDNKYGLDKSSVQFPLTSCCFKMLFYTAQ